MKRKRDRERDEEREAGRDLGSEDYQKNYDIISKEERENAELTLKHNLPAFLVREMQAKGKIKNYETRAQLSTTLKPETLQFIREMGAEWGLSQGHAIDKLVRIVREALKQGESGQDSAIERAARKRQRSQS